MPEPTPPSHLSADAAAAWLELRQGDETKPQLAQLEGAAVQLARARDAQKRIDTEGLLVSGDKGSVIPHPAIQIEKSAHEQLRKWGDTLKPPPRARRTPRTTPPL